MREHHLGQREALALMIIFLGAKLFRAFPRSMAKLGGPAGWMVVLFGVLSAAISLLLIDRALAAARGKSLIAAAEEGLGPWLGGLASVAILLFFFGTTSISMRQYSENLLAVFLPRTPLQVVMGAYLGAATFIAYLGVEGLARTAWLLGPWLLAGLATLLAGALLTFTSTGGLTPFWGPGLPVVITEGLFRSGVGAEILGLAVLAPVFRKEGQVRAVGFRTLIAAGLLMVVVQVVYSLFFPHPASTRVAFPLLQVSRLIVAGRWFQRVEAVYLVSWVVLATLYSAAGVWIVAKGFAEVFRIPHYRHLLAPLGLLFYSTGVFPESLVHAQIWQGEVLKANAWVVTHLVPMVIWAGLGLRRPRERPGAADA